jgi:hypothetical protein
MTCLLKMLLLSIQNTDTEKQLVFNTTSKNYELKANNDFKIEQGKIYLIKVVSKEGKSLTAQFTGLTKVFTTNEIEKLYRGTDLVDIRLKWSKNNDEYYVIKPYDYQIYNNKEYITEQKNSFLEELI